MDDLFQEIFERLKWTRSEIELIEKDISAWVGRMKVLQEPAPLKPGFFAVVVEAREALPISVRARSGTTINEIRSCLDSLASALAARNGREKAYFPVADNEQDFTDEKRLRERLKKFRDADRDALLAFRPFGLGVDGKPGNMLLYGLHHVDIKRKHYRLVAQADGSSVGLLGGVVGEMTMTSPPFNAPGRTTFAWVSADSSVRLSFKPEVLYAEPEALRGMPVVKILNDCADMAETIVRSFL